MNTNQQEHNHYTASEKIIDACSHIPWYDCAQESPIITCDCGEKPKFRIHYNFCSCGRMLGQFIINLSTVKDFE